MIFNSILTQKIGFGRCQYFVLFVVALFEIGDGSNITTSSLQNTVLQKQWRLSSNDVALLTALFYVGFGFGGFVCGRAADQFGRKPIIIVGSIVQIIISTMFLFVNSFAWLALCRIFYGFACGSTFAIGTTFYAEFVPLQYQGKGILIVNFFSSIGKIYGICLAQIFLKDYVEGNWRMMMFCSAIPGMLVLVSSFFITETPRFLFSQKRYEQAFAVMNIMANRNSKDLQLTSSEKEELELWVEQTFQEKQSYFCSVFNETFYQTTIILMIAWFCSCFNYFGQLTLLPYIFQQKKKTFWSYFVTVLAEIPVLIMNLCLADRESIGRKKIFVFSFFVAALFHLIFAFFPLTVFSFLCRFFMKAVFQISYLITTQSYISSNRGFGFGINSGTGRFAAAIMPFVVINIAKTKPPLVSIIFMILSLVGGSASIFLKDTTGKELDQIKNYEMNQINEESD